MPEGEGTGVSLVPDPQQQSMEAIYDMVSSVVSAQVSSELAKLQAGEPSPAGPTPSTPLKRQAASIALSRLPKVPRLSTSNAAASSRGLPAGTPAPPTLQGDLPTSLGLSTPSSTSHPILVAPSTMISATIARQ